MFALRWTGCGSLLPTAPGSSLLNVLPVGPRGIVSRYQTPPRSFLYEDTFELTYSVISDRSFGLSEHDTCGRTET